MTPLVSVIIPTFNRLSYLRTALTSAVHQSLADIEIIVHDNASDTDPRPLVTEFADPRISLYRNASNIGQTANMLAAIRRSRGKYVAVLGDDDMWHHDFLATLVPPLEANTRLVVAFCDHFMIDEDDVIDARLTRKVTHRHGRHLLAPGTHERFDDIGLVYRAIPVVSGAVIRRDAIDWSAVPADLPVFADIYICYLLAMSGGACHYEPRRVMRYRHHAGQLTEKERGNWRALDRFGLRFWSIFFADQRVRDRSYFQCMCARKALRLMFDRLIKRDWRGLVEDWRVSMRLGVLDLRVVYYHLVYLVRFRRRGIARIIP